MRRGAAAVLVVMACLALARPLQAEVWTVNASDSRLAFRLEQQGTPLAGRFESFQADIRFDPDALSQSRFEVTVDVASVTTGSFARDRYLPGLEWFAVDRYPSAHYVADHFTRDAGDSRQFLAAGELTLRGTTHPVALRFRWTEQGAHARLTGEAVIDRTDFGVGQGMWAEDEPIGRRVTVLPELYLDRR